MTNEERKLIIDLMVKTISDEDFRSRFSVDVVHNPRYIIQLLESANNERNSDDVEFAMFVGFEFKLFTEEFCTILSKLIRASWHYQHENIAMIFQKLKLPQTVECLYETALARFEYLAFDEAFALAVKCIWALGDINTPESREKLKLLSQSDNEIIKENAINQLNRHYK